MSRELEIVGYTEAYIADVNRILQSPYITAMGAYCLAIAESIYRNTTGKMPPFPLMQLAADCSGVEEVIGIVDQWIAREAS